MRKSTLFAALAVAMAVSGCASSGGLFGRDRPDEYAVTRNAPLVVPPNYALVPPQPGAPIPTADTAANQTLRALFGGTAPRSPAETTVINRAGGDRADPGIRSTAGDPTTNSVDKGTNVRTILAAPQGAGRDADAALGAAPQTTLPNPDTKQPEQPAPTPKP